MTPQGSDHRVPIVCVCAMRSDLGVPYRTSTGVLELDRRKSGHEVWSTVWSSRAQHRILVSVVSKAKIQCFVRVDRFRLWRSQALLVTGGQRWMRGKPRSGGTLKSGGQLEADRSRRISELRVARVWTAPLGHPSLRLSLVLYFWPSQADTVCFGGFFSSLRVAMSRRCLALYSVEHSPNTCCPVYLPLRRSFEVT